ncbi:MAG: 3-isopropylmalate dehydratase small subunit [Thermoleophilia bacterium]|jgi:3-isopropylmalate/(R)-2-methylmalate dehydratase small subunit|nr:3-isopropylmalate dehydratase small subunit [Thermoleophilia bacterium]
MDPITIVTSKVAPMDRADVDTDQIIPKQFLKRIERTGFGEFLFHDWRDEDFYLLDRPEYAGARILVAGRNFGCGSSREHAPWAIQDFGFDVVIAPSFADIFRTNCTKIGMLPVTLPDEDVRAIIASSLAEPGCEMTVDLEECAVTRPDGRTVEFHIEDSVRDRLLNGWDDIGLTLQRAGAIDAYEADREREGPVTSILL